VSIIPDMIQLDIDIINMRFEYSDTDTVLDIKYPDSDPDRSEPLYMDSVSNTVGKCEHKVCKYPCVFVL
jgi:hypothetical protein